MYNGDYVQAQALEQTRSGFATRVYGWMTLGLAVTAVVAFYIVYSGLYVKLMPFWFVPMIGTFVFALSINRMVRRLSYRGLSLCFMGYALLMGLFMGIVLPLYAAAVGGQVIWLAFLTAAFIFGSAALYGAVTKSDLTRLSRILRMGLIGLIGVTAIYFVMSFFTYLPWMMLLISYLGLVVFVGLTAYDAQKIRLISEQAHGDTVALRKASVMLALGMYLNVIMIFWYLLQIFSSSRR